MLERSESNDNEDRTTLAQMLAKDPGSIAYIMAQYREGRIEDQDVAQAVESAQRSRHWAKRLASRAWGLLGIL